MEHQHSEEELKNIAKQLSCPEGEQGIKTGEMMHASNIGMTSSAIDALNLHENEIILEIGPGNGGHIGQLLTKANHLHYFGADISATIIAEAEKINHDFIANGTVHFKLTDQDKLPFENNQFDKVFTVNTIYFWKNPNDYLKEIKRTLKENGLLVLCFADQNFMQKLPFTAYGFTLYTIETAKALLENAGFTVQNVIKKREQIKSKTGSTGLLCYFSSELILKEI